MSPKNAPAEIDQELADALERARLAVGVAAGVQYELDRMVETLAAYDTQGTEAQSILRRAALALDSQTSEKALKALDAATQHAEYFTTGTPDLEQQIAAVRRTAEAWRQTASVHIAEARELGATLGDVDEQIRGLADEGLRRLT